MIPFQYDRPVFVKIPFDSKGRTWELQSHFPWKELSVDQDKAQLLYNRGFLYHNSDLEVKAKVGDGLDELDVESLGKLVDSINKKVKAKTNSQSDYDRKKCKKSRIADKQRGLIRSWRRTNGHLEND